MRRRPTESTRSSRPHLLAALVIGFATLLGACATPEPNDPATSSPEITRDSRAHPPFHLVASRGGAQLALLGTVHAGPAEGWSFPEEIEAAFARSDALVLEVDLASLDQKTFGDAIAARAILQDGKRLPDVLSPETRAMIDERDSALSAAGLPAAARSLYEPWFLTLSLVELISRGTPYSLEAGVENGLLARRGDRPVIGLETIGEQLDLFDRLDPALQDLILRDTLARLPEAAAELEVLIEAWRIGDRAELFAQTRAGVDELPALEAFYVALVDQRNERWARQLDEMLRDPARAGQTLFVAVGAMHLVGEVGVPRLLERAGHDVTLVH